METEFKYIILRVLEHNNFPPKLLPDQWIPKETLDFHEMKCICIHVIKQLCFIEHTPTKLEFLVGNDCIKKVGFHKIHKHNNERKKVAKKAEDEAEEKRKIAAKKAEEHRKLMDEIAKKIEDEAEEKRIVIQKINNILKYWPHDTFTNSVKQQVVSGRTNLSSGQIEVIEKKIEEAEEQRITIQQIDVVLLCWSSNNTTAQGIKQWIDSGHTSLTSKQIAAIKNMHKSLNPIEAKKALESL